MWFIVKPLHICYIRNYVYIIYMYAAIKRRIRQQLRRGWTAGKAGRRAYLPGTWAPVTRPDEKRPRRRSTESSGAETIERYYYIYLYYYIMQQQRKQRGKDPRKYSIDPVGNSCGRFLNRFFHSPRIFQARGRLFFVAVSCISDGRTSAIIYLYIIV